MSQHFMIKRLSILSALAAAPLGIVMAMAGTAQAGAHSGQGVSNIEELPVRAGDWSDEEIARGRKQLVAAIDAAWIRIIDSRRDQAFWQGLADTLPAWDRMIEEFNAKTGVD